MILRPETPSDRASIAAVVEQAFGKPNEARLVEQIRESDNFIPELSLVAEEDGEVVGHALFSHVGIEGPDGGRALALAPVAVRPDRQRRGVGIALIEEGLRIADARGETLVVVLGHASYYPRFGFTSARGHGVDPPSPDIRDESFMALPLSRYTGRPRGMLVYPPAFEVT